MLTEKYFLMVGKIQNKCLGKNLKKGPKKQEISFDKKLDRKERRVKSKKGNYKNTTKMISYTKNPF